MFEAQLKQGKIFKEIIEAMKDLVTDANLECGEEGLKLQAMDSSHVSLISLALTKAGFDDFRCDRNLFLGLNLANLSKILKCAGSGDSITLRAEDEGDSVSIIFESEHEESVSDFELKLMDIDGEHLAIPETQYKCKVSMPSGDFQRICRDLASIGDTCTISISKEGVKFSVKGDLGTGNILRKAGKHGGGGKKGDKEESEVTIEMDEPVELTFALRYLGFFCKASPLSPNVNLHMSKDVPLMVEYVIEDKGVLKFFLAPKIDEE